ncbi:hypothetical protein BSLG_005718 [Batrachochytrium salamandrivorans]|nr:hypothetical protein BSLG_005718 [Batrachochytrium salamandrivorans]
MCQTLATTIPAADTGFVRQIVEEEYTVNWLWTVFPAAQLYKDLSTNENYYSSGFEFGRVTDTDQTVINNHYNIIIHYHLKEAKARVVGVLVQPSSGTKDVQDSGCKFGATSNFSLKKYLDIARYNALGDEDGAQEEFGWKMVHADVFRPPAFRMLLSIFQRRSWNHGTYFYILFSAVAGYVSAVLYKTLQGEHWRKNVVLTAVLVPGIIFGVLIILNFF